MTETPAAPRALSARTWHPPSPEADRLGQRLIRDLTSFLLSARLAPDYEYARAHAEGFVLGQPNLMESLVDIGRAATRESAGAGLDELRALSEAATPGELYMDWAKGSGSIKIMSKDQTVALSSRTLALAGRRSDAAFIVAAVNYVRARLAAAQKETPDD